MYSEFLDGNEALSDDELVRRTNEYVWEVKFDDFCRKGGMVSPIVRPPDCASIRCEACSGSKDGCEQCADRQREERIRFIEREAVLCDECRHEFAKKAIIEVIVAASKDGRDLKDEFEYIRKFCSRNVSFFRALARGLEESVLPLFDPFEILFIYQWERVKLFGRSLPGLKHWSVAAMAQYMRFRLRKDSEGEGGVSDEVIDKRKRLRLKASSSCVRDFRYKYLTDGKANVGFLMYNEDPWKDMTVEIDPIQTTFTVLPKLWVDNDSNFRVQD